MRRKLIEVANQHNITGAKRVIFYIVAPLVAGVSRVTGFVKGYVKGFVAGVSSSLHK